MGKKEDGSQSLSQAGLHGETVSKSTGDVTEGSELGEEALACR